MYIVVFLARIEQNIRKSVRSVWPVFNAILRTITSTIPDEFEAVMFIFATKMMFTKVITPIITQRDLVKPTQKLILIYMISKASSFERFHKMNIIAPSGGRDNKDILESSNLLVKFNFFVPYPTCVTRKCEFTRI